MLRVILITLCIFICTASTTVALAAVAKNTISSQQAANVVKQRYGGRVLKVQKQAGKNAYKVKIVKPNGQVVSKRVNAKTGKIEKN